MNGTEKLLDGLTEAQDLKLHSTISAAAYRAARNAQAGEGRKLYDRMHAAGQQWINANTDEVELLFLKSPHNAGKHLFPRLVAVMVAARKQAAA